MKDYSYELLDLLEKYKGDAEAALSSRTFSGAGRRMTGCVGSCFFLRWPGCPG